jgi:hypothetical protein
VQIVDVKLKWFILGKQHLLKNRNLKIIFWGGNKMNALQEENLQFIKTFLEDDLEENVEAVKERFRITDLGSLTWTFENVKSLTEKAKEIKDVAQAQRSKIDYWESKEMVTINNSLEFFQNLIAEYHSTVLAENPKSKTIKTPYGNTKAKTTKEQPEKVDEDTILQHVIESGLDDYLKTSLKWGDFKKELKIAEVSGEKVIVDSNGQIVPGVKVKPETTTFSMEIL